MFAKMIVRAAIAAAAVLSTAAIAMAVKKHVATKKFQASCNEEWTAMSIG